MLYKNDKGVNEKQKYCYMDSCQTYQLSRNAGKWYCTFNNWCRVVDKSNDTVGCWGRYGNYSNGLTSNKLRFCGYYKCIEFTLETVTYRINNSTHRQAFYGLFPGSAGSPPIEGYQTRGYCESSIFSMLDTSPDVKPMVPKQWRHEQ